MWGLSTRSCPPSLHRESPRQEGDAVVINAAELGIEKVLGSGQVNRKLNISAAAFSAQAKAKIEKTGGKAQVV